MNARGVAVIGFLALTPLAAPDARQVKEASNEVVRAFKPGGSIGFDLSAGAYTIRGRSDDAIRVRWRTRNPEDAARVRTEVEVKGTTAMVRTRGPRDNLRVDIDVPERADLDLTLSAGELAVRGIEGNKTLSMWAGDVTIEVGRPEQYREVDVSVRFGELTVHPFGRNTGGVFRSFSWTGSGKYRIRAKLFAGDLKLVR